MKKVDETINAICEFIQEELENEESKRDRIMLCSITNALAQLVSARAKNN